MTSPFAPGAITPADVGGVRVAFYGRAANAADAPTAIQRQLRAVVAALPSEVPIVGYFADVGPWNGLPGSILNTDTWSLDGHAVDGGLIDLLDRTRRPNRHFDIVACSDTDRLSRRLVDRVRIEDDLAAFGIRVITAGDPTITTPYPLDIPDAAQKRLRRWAGDLVTAETSHYFRDTSMPSCSDSDRPGAANRTGGSR